MWQDDEEFQRRVVAEIFDNNVQQERSHGTPVEYGQVVRLYNPLRRKFVRVSRTRSAEVEPSNMRIELNSEVSEYCNFRIMPRYKIRAVGDFICQGDDIMLEELDLDQRGRNQYIHGCAEQLGVGGHASSIYSAVGKGQHEVALSAMVVGSSFDIRCIASGGKFKKKDVPDESVEAFMNKQVQSMLKQKGMYGGKPIPEKEHTPVHASMVIQIEHKDSTSHLQAEGEYDWDESGEFGKCFGIKHDVYMHCGSKQRGVNNPKQSALTYFKIEKERITEGGLIAWDEPIRLQHLTTGLYLSVNSESVPQLVPLQVGTADAGRTLFKMVPFLKADTRDNAASHSNTLFRLQNSVTGLWVCGQDQSVHNSILTDMANSLLTSLKRAPGASTKFAMAGGELKKGGTVAGTDALKVSVNNLRDTHGKTMQLGTCQTTPFKDTFAVRIIKDVDAHHMGFVTGCRQVLHEYVVRKRTGKLAVNVDELLILLKEMNAFLYTSEIPQRTRQKMYRDFKVVDLLIEMLKAPYSLPCNRPDADHLMASFDEVCDAEVASINDSIFLVLESYLKGNSRKNELYIAKHIPIFWNMFGTQMEVEHMFTEMVRDNSILVSFFNEEHINVIIELLKKEHNPEFLTFLSVLCVCQERPRRVLQDTIGKLLFEGFDPKKHPFFYTTTVDTDEYGTEIVRVSSAEIHLNQNVTLASFFASGMDGDDATTTTCTKFLNRQLLLFGRLCRGRHKSNIDIISRDYVPWKECFLCAQKSDLPLVLRTYYTRVLMNIYVDVNPNRDVLSEVQLNYEWEKVEKSGNSADGDPSKSISGATFSNFPQVNAWVKGILETNSTLFYDSGSNTESGTAKQKNEYLAGILRLLYKLIIFGYYTNLNDIDDLLSLLIKLLDGSTDQEKSGRYHKPPKADWMHSRHGLPAKAVHECKHQALLCVDGLLNFAMHSRIRLLLADFKQVFLALPEEEEVSTFWGSIAHESKLALIARTMVGKQAIYAPPITSSKKKRSKKIRPWGLGRNKIAAAEAFTSALDAGTLHANNGNTDPTSDGGWDDGLNDDDELDDLDNPAKLMLRLAMEVVQGMQRGSTEVTVPEAVKQKAYEFTDIVREYVIGHTRVARWNADVLPRVLLDLAQYPSNKLRESSLSLLHRIFTQRKDEFSLSVQSRVLLSQQTIALSRKAYGDDLVEIALPGGKGTSMEAPGVPNLKLWSQGGFFLQEDANRFVWALQTLAHDCFHRERILGADLLKQKVLFNAGVHTVVLGIIRNSTPTHPRVLQACFNYLAALVDDFPLAQAKIYGELNMILTIHRRKQYVGYEEDDNELEGEPWQNALGRLLSNLFTRNIEASLGIRSSQIESILELITLWTWRAPQLLAALTMVATSQQWNIPLRRNQEVIVLNLWKNRVKVLQSSYVGVVRERKEREVQRAKLLETTHCAEQASRGQSQWELEYHINLIDLLSTACAGKSSQIEAKCRRLLSIDEVVTTLKSPSISPINKGPYMTYLMWVHLNTELHVADDCSDDDGNDEDIVLHDPNIADTDVLEMLAAAQITSTTRLSPYARALVGEATEDDDISMSGRRERYFIFDQFIPFVSCLLSMEVDWFLDGHDVASYIETIVKEVSNVVTCTRAQSSRTGAKLGKFRSYRIKELVSAVQKVLNPEVPVVTLSATAASEPKSKEFEAFEASTIKRIEVHLQALQDGYQLPVDHRRPSSISVSHDAATGVQVVKEDDEGMEEVELDVNILFNAFIKVLQTSYEAKNTIGAQLQLPPGVRMNDEVDAGGGGSGDGASNLDDPDDDPLKCVEDLGKPYADEDFGVLPLGPAFQQLTHCFVKGSRFRTFLVGLRDGDDSLTGGGLFDRKLLNVLRKLFEGYHKGTDTNIQIALLQAVRGVLRAAHIISPQCLIATQDQVATELAVPLARFPLRSDVVAVRSETLEVLRSVVHGGNATAQRVMTAYFLSTRDEMFFVICDKVLTKAKQSILERESLLMQKAEADAFQELMREELGRSFTKFISIDLTPLDTTPVSQQAKKLYKMWDFSEAELTLEILQLFCEGHNTFLQNYIRTQEDNYGSGKNLVWATTELLATATAAVVSGSNAFDKEAATDAVDGDKSSGLALVREILEFLNECAGGNFHNTEVIANSKAVDNVVAILALTRKLKLQQQHDAEKANKPPPERDWGIPENNSVYSEDVVLLDIACANLLRTFLESNSPCNRGIMEKVAKSVNIDDVFFQMSAYYSAAKQESSDFWASLSYAARHSFEWQEKGTEIEQRYFMPAFSFYTVLAKLQDFTGMDYGSALDKKSDVYKHFGAIAKDAASVEIWIDDTLQKVYFYLDPELLKLFIGPEGGATRSRQTRELEWTNNQGKDRAETFILTCRKIIADHRRINTFLVQSRFSKKLIEYSPTFRDITYALSWSINFLMVCFWAAKDGDYPYVESGDSSTSLFVTRGH